MGLDETLEGEEMDEGNHVGSGDKKDLQLPKPQRELMERVMAVGKPVIVVLMAGSAIDLCYADEHAQAILQAWYPGAEGGKAIAQLLFGEYAPSGKLPITFYRSLDGMPEFTDYTMKGRTYRYMEDEALYPFGFGLTYGKAVVTDAKILNAVDASSDIQVEAVVKNTGDCKVTEVLQLYIKDEESAYAVKNYSLCGFQRVELEPGQETCVQMTVSNKAMTAVTDQGERIIDSTKFTLFVGFSQPDARSTSLRDDQPIALSVSF